MSRTAGRAAAHVRRAIDVQAQIVDEWQNAEFTRFALLSGVLVGLRIAEANPAFAREVYGYLIATMPADASIAGPEVYETAVDSIVAGVIGEA